MKISAPIPTRGPSKDQALDSTTFGYVTRAFEIQEVSGEDAPVAFVQESGGILDTKISWRLWDGKLWARNEADCFNKWPARDVTITNTLSERSGEIGRHPLVCDNQLLRSITHYDLKMISEEMPKAEPDPDVLAWTARRAEDVIAIKGQLWKRSQGPCLELRVSGGLKTSWSPSLLPFQGPAELICKFHFPMCHGLEGRLAAAFGRIVRRKAEIGSNARPQLVGPTPPDSAYGEPGRRAVSSALQMAVQIYAPRMRETCTRDQVDLYRRILAHLRLHWSEDRIEELHERYGLVSRDIGVTGLEDPDTLTGDAGWDEIELVERLAADREGVDNDRLTLLFRLAAWRGRNEIAPPAVPQEDEALFEAIG